MNDLLKKNNWIFIFILVLGFTAIWLYFKRSDHTIQLSLRDFAIKDTGSIDKIFLADKTGAKVLLERNPKGVWIVNGTTPARPESVKIALYTFLNMRVKNPVPKAGRDGVLRHMATHAIKVQIYQHGEIYKTIYVGGATQDQLGTFMLLEGSQDPFVMEIQGFKGYLTSRFNPDSLEWVNRNLFSLKRDDIESVRFDFYGVEFKSFFIQRKDAHNMEIGISGTETITQNSDSGAVARYLGLFSNLQFERYVRDEKKHIFDSLNKEKPLAVLTLDSKLSGKTTHIFFPVPLGEGSLIKENGDGPLKHDPDRLFCITPDHHLVLSQYFALNPVFAGPTIWF